MAISTGSLLGQSIKKFQTILSVDENNLEANYGLALAYDTDNNLSLAIKQYKRCVDIQPNFASAHFNLGLCYAALEELELAKNEWQIAIDLDSMMPERLFDPEIALFTKKEQKKL